MKEFKYDIAISFAGEQRQYAHRLANKMKNCGLSVFYDNWNSTSIWGRDLTRYLAKIYIKESRYTITLFSKEYINKYWTKLEFELMQDRQYRQDDYILPVTMDGSIPENWPVTRGIVKAADYSIDQIALMARQKVYSELYQADEFEDETDIDEENYSRDVITITSEDGTTEEYEIIVAFELEDVKREYVVYTQNEVDNSGNVMVYVSQVVMDGEEAVFVDVAVEDWPRIKEVLRELSQNGNGGTIPKMKGVFKDKDGVELLL